MRVAEIDFLNFLRFHEQQMNNKRFYFYYFYQSLRD